MLLDQWIFCSINLILCISTADLADAFGISKSTSVAKSSEIRKLLKMDYLTDEWILPSRLDDFTAIWMIEVNGFIFDDRKLPYELQSIAYEKGLIPYISADRKEKADSWVTEHLKNTNVLILFSHLNFSRRIVSSEIRRRRSKVDYLVFQNYGINQLPVSTMKLRTVFTDLNISIFTDG